ncbi:MAG: glycosyltransferase family 2 protein [Pseudomonadota bacterium]
MKLIVQIPCFNEEENLIDTIGDIPREIPGIDVVEIMVIDDGSSDRTIEVAREIGVEHIVEHTGNKGLARTFRSGIDSALKLGADIIVNTDGDNQYAGADIAKLIEPIVQGDAEIVVGDRGGLKNPHFPYYKRQLQVFGSYVIRKITGLDIADAVSGFRAISKNAAKQINIVTDFSYTIEMLVQASAKRLKVVSVPIGTNAKTRDSRLFKSIPQFLRMSGTTLIRAYAMYKPLRLFFAIGMVMLITGLLPIGRFLYFYMIGDGAGHIQSIVLGATLVIMGVGTMLIGMLADLINFNRKLLELALVKIANVELQLEEQKNTPGKSHFKKIEQELSELKVMTK